MLFLCIANLCKSAIYCLTGGKHFIHKTLNMESQYFSEILSVETGLTSPLSIFIVKFFLFYCFLSIFTANHTTLLVKFLSMNFGWKFWMWFDLCTSHNRLPFVTSYVGTIGEVHIVNWLNFQSWSFVVLCCAVVMAQLLERSLPTPKVIGSNPVIDNFLFIYSFVLKRWK